MQKSAAHYLDDLNGEFARYGVGYCCICDSKIPNTKTVPTEDGDMVEVYLLPRSFCSLCSLKILKVFDIKGAV